MTQGRFAAVVLAALTAVISGLLSVPQSAAVEPAEPLVSDDFFDGFDTNRWQVVDPAGDGSVSVTGAGTGDARLAIGVPAGSSHDAWGSNGSVRVLQQVSDSDFEVEAKFDSVPSGTYADQGIQVVGADTWLRFSVYSSRSRLWAFAASTTGTKSTKEFSREVTAPSGQMWLRVARTGSQFTYSYSPDGQTWTSLGSFTSGLAVSRIGPYAGNASGSNSPAHTSLVDYVFDTTSPISPEDGGLGGGGGGGDDTDTTAPSVSAIEASPGATSARVSWTTDEPTTGHVQYGTSTGYGQSVASTDPGTTHQVTLTDLVPDTTYHYRVVATDAAGNTTTTQDHTLTTGPDGDPQIELWHQGTLEFGANGVTQPWVNVLGNVSDPAGVASLTYALNGGSPRTLTIGPDDRRLQSSGDFNADIPLENLEFGDNSVELVAVDNDGATTTVTTTVRRVAGSAPNLPYTLNWSDTTPLHDQVTVVDGKWAVTDQTAVPTRLGYDRLLALGDLSWQDYEVTVPVTVHEIGPEAHTGNSGSALVGMALRWQGHNGIGSYQPAWKFFPVGAYAWCRFYPRGPKLEILGNENDPHVAVAADPPEFQFGVPYVMKARVQSLPDGTTRFAYKMWLKAAAEPAGWHIDVVDDGPGSGSVGLIAHHVDAAFGTVQVSPL